jgi:DNA polymerase-1
MTKIIAFDIETASADLMHRYVPHDDQGYIRLVGWCDAMDPNAEIHTSTDPRELLAVLLDADVIAGHNILNFDLMAFAKHVEDRYETLARKSFDTMVVERHLVPVAAKGLQPTGFYGLDATAARRGCAGKSTVDFHGKVALVRRIVGDKKADAMVKARQKADDSAAAKGKSVRRKDEYSVLKVLSELYGGYDRIPLDDPDYVEYLRRDVRASAALYRALRKLVRVEPDRSVQYLRDEHQTSADMGRITIEGCRVDVNLNTTRLAAGQARLEAAKRMMHDRYGMPLEGAYPHRTNPGKAAFRAALLGTGIDEERLDEEWPTGADGFLLTGKDVLNEFIPLFERVGNTAAVEICRTILAMNGERTVYQTIDTHLTAEGRVHPYIGADQSSGRWSMKDPGLTVMGKRGGKAAERAVILADTDEEWIVAIDADQVDARGVAALSQDREYMKLFLPGTDLHSEVAWRVFQRPECRAEMERNNGRCDCPFRDRAKVFGHGWNYGMQPGTMAAMHGVPLDVAQQFDRGMQQAFPRLCEWKAQMRELAGALPFGVQPPAHDSYRILHTAYGRPVRVERSRAFTQATAQIGQGTTRDIMASSIRGLAPHIRRKVRAVIHDEIVISVGPEMTGGDPSREAAQTAAQAIADGMAFDLHGVRITFGCSRVARSWAGAYGEQYETAA